MYKLKNYLKYVHLKLYKLKKRLTNLRFYKFSFLRLLYPGVINSKYKINVASMFYYNESIFYWFKDNAQHLLFDHELSQDSLVIDVGAYHGHWCKTIFNKYECNIYAYEPVKKHFLVLKDRMKNYNKIISYNYGLGKNNKNIGVRLRGIQTTAITEIEDSDEIIEIRDIRQILELKNKYIDLFHVNIEGGEYELLDVIIDSNIIENIQSLEVQFHEWYPTMKKSKLLRNELQQRLKKTHDLIYSYDFIWEKWSKNT